MKEIIQVDETTRIRQLDSKNWTVELFSKPKRGDGGPRWEQANGHNFGPFASRPDSMVIARCLLDNAPELDGFNGTVGEYVAAMDRASRRIAASVSGGASC